MSVRRRGASADPARRVNGRHDRASEAREGRIAGGGASPDAKWQPLGGGGDAGRRVVVSEQQVGGGARVDYARVGDALRAARGPSHGRAVASGGFLSAASAVFLPEGYPATVAPEYLTFQAWDTVQASCSYLRGILATQALLGAVGVGDGRATALAATLAWVLRDGAGMVGSLVFAWWGAARFDADVRSWRLFADVINDVGLTLEMLAPLAGEHFLVVACVGNVCKALCGVAAGGTRATITAHFARADNLADVAAKEGSQETAVTLLGLAAGYAFASVVNEHALSIWVAFVLLTLLHVVANYKAVRALRLHTFNRDRLALALRPLLRNVGAPDGAERTDDTEADADGPERVGDAERIVRLPSAVERALGLRDAATPAVPIDFGCSVADARLSGALAAEMCAVWGHEGRFAVVPVPRGRRGAPRVAVLLVEGASAGDEITAYSVALVAARLWAAAAREGEAATDDDALRCARETVAVAADALGVAPAGAGGGVHTAGKASLLQRLARAGWRTEGARLLAGPWRVTWHADDDE